MSETEEFKTDKKIVWCSGCGNFGIFLALKQAFLKIRKKPDDICLVYGIGCHGHMVNYMKSFGFQAIHGRTLPIAQGVKIANKNLTVIAIAGDGDQLGEGGNHLIHAARRNIDITCIVHNNQIYALTVGQTSPTSAKGFKSRSTPEGSFEEPINPLSLSIASGASFVSRGFSGDVNYLTKLFVKALKHKGFSLVEVLQPCVTLNRINTYQYFLKRIYKLEETNFNYQDKIRAFEKSLEWGEKIPIGIFYFQEREIYQPTFTDKIEKINISNLLKEFK